MPAPEPVQSMQRTAAKDMESDNTKNDLPPAQHTLQHKLHINIKKEPKQKCIC